MPKRIIAALADQNVPAAAAQKPLGKTVVIRRLGVVAAYQRVGGGSPEHAFGGKHVVSLARRTVVGDAVEGDRHRRPRCQIAHLVPARAEIDEIGAVRRGPRVNVVFALCGVDRIAGRTWVDLITGRTGEECVGAITALYLDNETPAAPVVGRKRRGVEGVASVGEREREPDSAARVGAVVIPGTRGRTRTRHDAGQLASGHPAAAAARPGGELGPEVAQRVPRPVRLLDFQGNGERVRLRGRGLEDQGRSLSRIRRPGLLDPHARRTGGRGKERGGGQCREDNPGEGRWRRPRSLSRRPRDRFSLTRSFSVSLFPAGSVSFTLSFAFAFSPRLRAAAIFFALAFFGFSFSVLVSPASSLTFLGFSL